VDILKQGSNGPSAEQELPWQKIAVAFNLVGLYQGINVLGGWVLGHGFDHTSQEYRHFIAVSLCLIKWEKA